MDTQMTAVVRVKDGGQWSPASLGDKIGAEVRQQVDQLLAVEEDDLVIFACGHYTAATSVLGRLRLIVADLLEQQYGQIIRKKEDMNFLWVEDFPLFLPREDGLPGLESTHHPFTAPKTQDEHLVYSDPTKVMGQHYDLVLNGSEIGGGSIRIHNSSLQRYILTDILKEDCTSLNHLLQALDYGAPSHGGIAFGLDRLISMLCRANSIRDVIAFPKSSEGKDLMSLAPATVSLADKQYYHIK